MRASNIQHDAALWRGSGMRFHYWYVLERRRGEGEEGRGEGSKHLSGSESRSTTEPHSVHIG